MPVLTALEVADEPSRWRAAGFAVAADGTCTIGAVALRLLPRDGRSGIRSWSFDSVAVDDIDGLPTSEAPPPVTSATHPNGATAVDHVVVLSTDVDRTLASLQAVGLDPRRERLAHGDGAPVRQVFFRAGEAVIEVVGAPAATGRASARFFGVAVTVDDLDAAKSLLGEGLAEPKDAVQPGRRIATIRRSLALGTAVALMSPSSS